ncbi:MULTISPECIES: tRNA (guanosine(46)-N7)-methyltransferase TrmB [unclassified Clostridium]|uniref:tRNA (guanosine(46)-N7)-methyltransferase TrmB n=1 Tax=unclassified Clostridium TaxID=2614128 RepID=UPI0025C4DDAE|nr:MULTISPECIES: tRNA (guanosine(46)-N7)-methyltransferase TrmB [unclassified Clostridium]
MRLRKKHWARPEMQSSEVVVFNQYDHKGKWKEEFENNNEIHLELGCGRGGHITNRAKMNPNINYVGIDLKDEVLVYALRKVKEARVDENILDKDINVRLMPLNIMLIDNVFDKDEINKIYINFCNPWPKERHNKRRLTHTKFLAQYKKFLKKGGEIWFKTDDTGLFKDSIEYFKESGFEIEYITYDLHNSDFKDNVITEYEGKFTALGMKTMFLTARLK